MLLVQLIELKGRISENILNPLTATDIYTYPSNLIVSSAYSKYVLYINRGVKEMEKFSA
jgi:hypothetical protein